VPTPDTTPNDDIPQPHDARSWADKRHRLVRLAHASTAPLTSRLFIEHGSSPSTVGSVASRPHMPAAKALHIVGGSGRRKRIALVE